MTSVQLAACGCSYAAVSKRVRAGRLHRKHRGVYAVGHPKLSQHGLWLAAVFAAGDGAVLSHLSAAALWRVWRRAVPGIDITGSRSQRRRKGFRVHRSRSLDPRDVTVHQGIPVTTVPRTLVDLTDVLTAHQLANVIHEAAFRSLVSHGAVEAAMERANGRRLTVLGHALRLNGHGSAGTKSGLEDRFLALVGAAGLPDPVVNAAVQTEQRAIEVDFRWGTVCVEVDGGGHRRLRTRREDAARDRELRAAGYLPLRFAETDLDGRPEAVLTTVAQALRPPPPRHRGAGPRPP